MSRTGSPIIQGRCHCGAVRFALLTAPVEVTTCNCSICRRYATLWAYYPVAAVTLAADPEALDGYQWDDRSITFHRCRVCGCVTHWSAVDPARDRVGVNARLLDPAVLARAVVRRLDGAVTEAYLDPPVAAGS